MFLWMVEGTGGCSGEPPGGAHTHKTSWYLTDVGFLPFYQQVLATLPGLRVTRAPERQEPGVVTETACGHSASGLVQVYSGAPERQAEEGVRELP